MSQKAEQEPVLKPYRFVYRGELTKTPQEFEPEPRSNPQVLPLYRRRVVKDGWGPWCVVVDFPSPTKPLDSALPCSSFFDLLGLIEEDEAIDRFNSGQKKPEDDLLLFRRSLRGEKEPTICQGERNLEYKLWGYNMMGVDMQSRKPIPSYRCLECNKSNSAENYSEMKAHAIAFIAEKAARYRDKYDIYWGFTRPEEIDGMFESIRQLGC